MVMKIGTNAGKVYDFLKGKSQISVSAIVKGTNLKQLEVDRALGWLAREGKIKIDKGKLGEVFTLTE